MTKGTPQPLQSSPTFDSTSNGGLEYPAVSSSSEQTRSVTTLTICTHNRLQEAIVLDPSRNTQLEAPTAPSSPVVEAALVHRAQPTAADHSLLSINLPVIPEENIIKGGESRCAICKVFIPRHHKKHAVRHFNVCWDQLRAKKKKKDSTLQTPKDTIASGTVQSSTSKNSTKKQAPEGNQAVEKEGGQAASADTKANKDDFPLSVLPQNVPEGLHITVTPPTASSDNTPTTPSTPLPNNNNTTTRQPQIPSAHPRQPNNRQPPNPLPSTPSRCIPTRCLVCKTPLSHLCPIDTILHLHNCLHHFFPPACPICRLDFALETSPPWTPDTVLEHMDYCASGGKFSRAAHHAMFEATMAVILRRCNMARLVLRRVWGPRKRWGVRDHVGSFRAKRERQRLLHGEEGGPYRLVGSPLRNMV